MGIPNTVATRIATEAKRYAQGQLKEKLDTWINEDPNIRVSYTAAQIKNLGLDQQLMTTLQAVAGYAAQAGWEAAQAMAEEDKRVVVYGFGGRRR